MIRLASRGVSWSPRVSVTHGWTRLDLCGRAGEYGDDLLATASAPRHPTGTRWRGVSDERELARSKGVVRGSRSRDRSVSDGAGTAAADAFRHGASASCATRRKGFLLPVACSGLLMMPAGVAASTVVMRPGAVPGIALDTIVYEAAPGEANDVTASFSSCVGQATPHGACGRSPTRARTLSPRSRAVARTGTR